MEKPNHSPTYLERMLIRAGGSYLAWMQCFSLLVSFMVAIIGYYYIAVTTNLSDAQIFNLISISLILIAGTIIIITTFTLFTTIKTRTRLNFLIRGKLSTKTSLTADQELAAWQEISTFPPKIAIMEIGTIVFAFIIPIYIYFQANENLNSSQSIQTIIGLLIAGTGVLITNVLLREQILSPVKQLLIPSDWTLVNPTQFSRLGPRLLIVFIYLILSSIVMLGGIAFQELQHILTSGIDQGLEIIKFQNQIIILGGMILLYAIVMYQLIIQSIHSPLMEIRNAINRAQSGDSSSSAKILSNNEISHLTIQINYLLGKLRESQLNIESQVYERTSDLRRRADRLQASARLAKETSDARDLQSLLTRIVNLIYHEIGYYHTGIYLLDTTEEYAVLRSASSEGGKKMIARGYKVEIGPHSCVGIAAHQNRPYIVTDVDQDPYFRENSDLPNIRSQIAVPLSSRGKVIGILDIQSEDRFAFQQDDIELLQLLADQIALAILNVQLIEENRFTLSQMEAVLSENVRRSWGESDAEQKRAFRYTPTSLTPIHADEMKDALKDRNTAQLIIPISLRGQRIGSINIERKGGMNWSETDRSLASEVANQVGLALENSRLLEDAKQRALFEQTLSELTAKLGGSIDTDSLLNTAVKELHHLPNVTEVSIFLSPPESSNPKKDL